MSRKQLLLTISVLSILSVIAYVNTLQNEFVYDDNTVLGRIRHGEDLYKLFIQDYFRISGEASYRPVVTFSYFLDYKLFEFSPWGYHLTNVLIHVTNGILLYIFLLRTSEVCGISSIRPSLAFVGSVLFVSHPILTEAVNVISFREDILVFLFSFLALNLFTIIINESNRFIKYTAYLLSCLSYSLALFSKEMAISFPLLLLLWEILFIGKGTKLYSGGVLKQLRRVSGFVIVSIGYLFIRFYYFSNPREFQSLKWSIPERLLTLPDLLFNYIKLSIMPFSLSADYPINPISTPFGYKFILPTTIILFIGFLICQLSKQRQNPTNAFIIFGIAFFGIALLPVSNLIQIFNPMAERYIYLPMAGIVTAVGATVCSVFHAHGWQRYLPILGSLLVFIVMSNTILTINRNGIWKNDYTLWADTVKKVPNSGQAHYGLGNAYRNKGLLDDAIREYQLAIKLSPGHINSHANLGACYLQMGLLDKAQSEFEEVIKRNPLNLSILHNLGGIYFDKGLYMRALNVYRNILYLSPQDRYAKKMLDETLKK